MPRQIVADEKELDHIVEQVWNVTNDDGPDPAGIFHARAILNQKYTSDPGSVYAILDDENNIVTIVTVVRALLPGTTGRTLRVISIILAPEFGVDMSDHTRLETAFSHTIYEMVLTASDDPPCRHVKVYFGGQADRHLVQPIREELRPLPQFDSVDFHGQWINVTLRDMA